MSTIRHALIAMIAASSLLYSCDSAKQPKELFEEQQSGVCLVLNSYYYKIELPTGSTWYCSGIDADGDLENLELEEAQIKKSRAIATGTAFFIDNEGTLMTNRHVVNPAIEDDVIKNATSRFISQIKEYLQLCQTQYVQKYEELESQKQYCYTLDFWGDIAIDHDRYFQIEAAQRELASDFFDIQSAVSTIDDIDASNIRVSPISEIGIAYNNTYVTTEDDFLRDNPCIVAKISNDDDIDLALLQLKNKKTPVDRYVFKIKGRDQIPQTFGDKIAGLFACADDDAIDVDKDLIMIGFNAGMILGNTRQGIQAQMTSGKVSQKPDGTKILYSIPTLQGSSGSPVIDTDGYVRAVNFAKLRGTDTFNFGIPENLILKFLNQ